jgi:hypothetical protein
VCYRHGRMPTLEITVHQAYGIGMTSGRISWFMSWLSVIALVLTVAMPQWASAATMTAMMQTSHCTDCQDNAPMPDRAAGHHAKALPCSLSMCVGAVAAVLPTPDGVNQPLWRPAVYAPGPLAGPSGRRLTPDPLPPRPTVQA